jgi:hypothetical protein
MTRDTPIFLDSPLGHTILPIGRQLTSVNEFPELLRLGEVEVYQVTVPWLWWMSFDVKLIGRNCIDY